MAEILLGLGSNIDREHHLRAGIQALGERFGALQLSPVFESASVGFNGSPFFNLVVCLTTTLGVGELQRVLREVEYAQGRHPEQRKFSPRTLDIDILTYDDRVGIFDGVHLPRAEILENAYVLWPLACLVPNHLHPLAQRSYADLWSHYTGAQKIQRVDVPLFPAPN
ncbi:7,8-dihydro-6-hydroxymethylpterin-pyrophosphokinase [gamma proteobacterium HdN1]|nr:7,8-dihydro-6-hydroxymethylpterin-pyrophosphokinase [gamma proteobacterium HdN1]